MTTTQNWWRVAAAALAATLIGCGEQPAEPTPLRTNVPAAGPAVRTIGSTLDVGGQYLVMFKGQGVPARFAGDVQALGGAVVYSHDVGIALVTGLTAQAAATLGGEKYVSDLAADATFQLDDQTDGVPEAAQSAGVASAGDPTTAAIYARQWNMRAISADATWAAGRLGSPTVTVAILDTGIDYLYPDLAGRVDLSRSVSFVPSDDALVAAYFPGRNPITDLYFHGTHVAATVASNGLVAAGVTSGTTLTAVKVCNVSGSCSLGAVIAGVLYATDHGADVINMSLGGGFAKAGNGRFVGYINQVFNYANRNGVTVVVAAGNEAADLDHDGNTYATYCSTPNTICVSATGPTASAGLNGPWTDVDASAPYTNFGTSAVTVAAPGGSSAGYVWAACSETSLVIPVCQTGIYVLGVDGTSMATPHVSGVAALVVQDVGRRPGRVKTVLQNSADDLGKPGADPYYGKGRLNAAHAVGLP